MKLLIRTLLIVLIVSNSIQAQRFPGKDWDFVDEIDETKWNIDKGESFYRFLIDSTFITGMVIVHEGEVIFDYGDIKEVSYIASCRKSVLAMLYGQYVLDGTVDLEKTVN